MSLRVIKFAAAKVNETSLKSIFRCASGTALNFTREPGTPLEIWLSETQVLGVLQEVTASGG